MTNEKIRISWDDLHDPRVDDRLKRQEAAGRSQQHYQQQLATPPLGNQRPRLWYNTVFYMGVFGFVGGLLAWGFGEIVWRLGNRDVEQLLQLLVREQEVEADYQRGRLSREQAERAMKEAGEEGKRNPYLKIWLDEGLTEREKEQRFEQLVEKGERKAFVTSLLFCAICGTLIAAALAAAEPLVTRNFREALTLGSVGAALGLVGGVLVSLFIGELYRAFGGGAGLDKKPNLAGQMFARSVGWAVLGLFLSIAPGIVLRSWKKVGIGVAGGAIGGLLGGLLFDPIGMATNTGWLSRVATVAAIGAVAGVATGMIENAVKTGWLQVTAGLIAGKQFVLYHLWLR